MSSSELQPVTLDLIKELRYTGRYEEANALLNAWRNNKVINYVQEKKELKQQEQIKKATRGLCFNNNCYNERRPDLKTCEVCSNRSRQYYLNHKEEKIAKESARYHNKKSLGLCTAWSCISKALNGRSFCSVHGEMKRVYGRKYRLEKIRELSS